MEHTSGLWNKDRNIIEDSNGNVIAEVSYKQDGYVQANARLIASAPDLLEACKAVLDIINSYSHIPAQFKACQILQDAINKAERRDEG